MSAFSGNEDDKRPPAVSLSFPPRPPFAGLGGLTGGPFGSGSGSLPFSLKKREKKRFIDSELGSSSQTPTERLRQIDLLRLYTPLPEERKELRIPESIERLNLVEVKHLLLLCGGCAFVRFAPEEMTKILEFSSAIKEKFEIVENCFQKELDSSAKKCIIGKEGNDPTTEEKAKNFHLMTDELTAVIISLQDLVRSKVESIDHDKLSNESGPMKFESDPDEGSAGALSKPIWLSTLIDKYHDDVQLLHHGKPAGDSEELHINDVDNLIASTTTVSQQPLSSRVSREDINRNPPLGSFCAYLSYIVTVGTNRLTDKETHALYDLVQASVTFDSQVPPPLEERPSIEEMQKLWSWRFYNFLKKLSELKTALRDEKSLPNVQKYTELGGGTV